MSDFDWKWFTGFFEGEGSFGVSAYIRKKGRYKGNLVISVQLTVYNTKNDLINYIFSSLKNSGFHQVKRKRKRANCKPELSVFIAGYKNVLNVLNNMLPHFKSSYNRRIAELIIKFLKSRLSKDYLHSHYSQYEISIIKEILKMKKPNRDLSFLDEYKPSGFWKN